MSIKGAHEIEHKLQPPELKVIPLGNFFMRFSQADDPSVSIVMLYKPNGGILTSIPSTHRLWQDPIRRDATFGQRLRMLGDIEVSVREFERLKEFCVSMMQQPFSSLASEVTQRLIK